MSLTARQLNRATLQRQLVLRREPLTVADAVRRIVALQAQEPASPYLALWCRVDDFAPSDLDAAFAAGEVVKASLMRLTLHAVHADDHPSFHAALMHRLRGSRVNDRRFTSSGLTGADVDALLPDLLAFLDRPRTGEEIDQRVEELLGRPAPQVWWAARRFAPVHRAPTGGVWSFGSPSFLATPTRAGRPVDPTSVAAERLVERALEGFGPMSIADLAQFTILERTVVRDALTSLGDDVGRHACDDGVDRFDLTRCVLPTGDEPAPPRLLPMWDSTLLAFADRTRIVPELHRATVIRRNGDVLPTVLVDGHVAGVWRTTPTDDGPAIEVTAFDRLDDGTWAALETEARSLIGLLADRDPTVYGRYGHWWTKGIAAAEIRVLRS